MKAALKRKVRFPRDLEQYIDPRVPVVEAVELVLTNLKTAGLGPEPGSPTLHRARRGVLTVLRAARRLNGMPFWKSITIPRAQKSRTPETAQEHRAEMLETAREHLHGGGATRADILAAMDALHEVVVSMTTIFAAGRVVGMDEPEESWALDRYTCAALLPTLEERLRHFWLQLHGGVVESDSVR